MRLIRPEVGDEELRLIREVFESGLLTASIKTEEFENLIAGYVGAKYAVAVSSGTAALHLSLLGINIGVGDEVIVPDFTFPATANVVKMCGAEPILVDVDLNTFNIDVDAIEAKITAKTKAVISVDLFGLPAQLDKINELAKKYNLTVVDDAACALGSKLDGYMVGDGQFASLTCFSFHPRKIITTGEGGMIVTNSSQLAEKLKQLRNHHLEKNGDSFHVTGLGYNYRLNDILSAIGIAQFGKLENIIKRRRGLAHLYTRYLSPYKQILPQAAPDTMYHTYQSYVIRLDDKIKRDIFRSNLHKAGVETTIGTYAVHLQPYYRQSGEFKNSRKLYETCVSLPLHLGMGEKDVKTVVSKIEEALLAKI